PARESTRPDAGRVVAARHRARLRPGLTAGVREYSRDASAGDGAKAVRGGSRPPPHPSGPWKDKRADGTDVRGVTLQNMQPCCARYQNELGSPMKFACRSGEMSRPATRHYSRLLPRHGRDSVLSWIYTEVIDRGQEGGYHEAVIKKTSMATLCRVD